MSVEELRRRAVATGRWLLGPGAPLAVLLLLAWSVVLRTRNLDAPLWIDEGISVGVAHFPFWDIPSALRLDGNPPTYYWLLHLWLRAFGDSETAAHALSLCFALATVPVAWLLARRPLGPAVALAAAAAAAVLPYLTYFGQETRMYAMVALLSLLVAGLHLRAFEPDARRSSLAGLGVVLVVALYTHSWAVFLFVGSVAAVGARLLLEHGEDRRRVLRRGFAVHLVAGLVWLPWLPTLLRQAKETGAPWSLRPSLKMLVEGVGSVGGPGQVQSTIMLTALVLGGGALAAAAGGRLRGRGVAPQEEARALRRVMVVLSTLLLVTVLAAYVSSLMNPAWANRYMGVAVGPFVLLIAVTLARTGRMTLLALVVLIVSWGIATQGRRLNHKGSPEPMAATVAAQLRPGDLVISIHPEQLPAVSYYLDRRGAPERGLRYATALGRQRDVRLFDWRHALDRFRAATPWATAQQLLAAQPAGSRVLLVLPVLSSGNWSGDWTRLVAARTSAWRVLLSSDPRLRLVGRRPVVGPPQGVYGLLFRVER